MITNFSAMQTDFLQNGDICCLYCSIDGRISRISRGMEMRYPNAFRAKESIWQYVSSIDAQTELANALPSKGYYITPDFILYGKSCFFCCLSVHDPAQHKNGMLCILESTADSKHEVSKLTHCRSLVEQFNASLLCDIVEQGRKLTDAGQGEQLACMGEAAIRNNTLLAVFENEMQVGSKEDRVVMSQLCAQMVEQCNYALAGRGEKLQCMIEVSNSVYHLDLECFLDMFAALLALYHLTGTPQGLMLSMTEQKGGKFLLRADGLLIGRWNEKQGVLADLLKNILEEFASHYSGSAFCSLTGDRLTVGMAFALCADHSAAGPEMFARSPLQFSLLDRALPLLRYADR